MFSFENNRKKSVELLQFCDFLEEIFCQLLPQRNSTHSKIS